MKRNSVLIPALLAALLVLLTVPGAAADVSFSAVNNELLALEAQYMPYNSGLWYIPVPVLEKGGVSASYSREQQILVLFNAQHEIRFDLRYNDAYDYDQRYPNFRAIQSGSFFYVPADFVIRYFGYDYSVIDSIYGPVLRVKTTSVYSDATFLTTVRNKMRQAYTDFTGETAPTPEPTPEPEVREVYLTFDDGPVPGVTEQILDTLDEYNMKATFFVLGESIDRAPEKNADILRRQLCAGHSIGLHGYSHIGFYQSPEKMLGDLERVNDILYDVMLYRTRLVRTPYGSRGKLTPRLEEALNGAGYRFWDWNVDPRDAVDAPSGEQIVRRVTRALDEMTDRPAVIVMHDMPNTAQALPGILAFLQEKAYTVRTISAHERPQNSIHVVTDQRTEEDISVAGEGGEVTPS